jgi:hypothetical protein
MIIVGDAIVSDDIAERAFVCDLTRCKGACCEEGDYGAPLTEDEILTLEDIQDDIAPYLSAEGRAELKAQGAWVVDGEGELSTPTIGGKACAYAVYELNGTLKCGIERAWKAGATDFQKPISCHLYPIRVTKYDHYMALNYNMWSICSPACSLGEQLKVPIYKFLEGALTRAFGQAWYKELCHTIETGDYGTSPKA